MKSSIREVSFLSRGREEARKKESMRTTSILSVGDLEVGVVGLETDG